MESQRFDESFKHAFEGAELAPTDSVWTNVELELEKTSGGKMKRRLIMFQLLAAASTVFALGMGGIYYLNIESVHPKGSVQSVAQNKPEIYSTSGLTEKTKTLAEQNNVTKQRDPVSGNIVAKKPSEKKPETETNKTNTVDQQSVMTINTFASGNLIAQHKTDDLNLNRGGLNTYRYPVKVPGLTMPVVEESVPDPGMLLLARLKDEEKKYLAEYEKEKTTEKLWTSIGMGAGTYDPNMSASSSALNASGGRSSGSQPSNGASYSVGLAVGHKISKRFIIQGGVSYLTQRADFSSSASQKGFAALTEYASVDKSRNDFAAASPYTVNSSLQFISVPLQAGYILIDKAFAIQLNGGVATDLFLRNTLTPADNSYKKVSQSSGDDSPYRTVNFSGLLGTEFSYKLAQQYRISVAPGLRYSLNSIYKSEVGTQLNPIAYDVSLRFRYIFK